MENKGLYNQQYYTPQRPAYTVPVKDEKQSAVNVYINANGQQQPAYPYYYPYYYPYPYYSQNQSNNSLGAQNLNQVQPEPKDKKEEKELTPLTPEILNGLKNDLTQGDKQARQHAVARAINLINEDRETRSKDQRLIGLIQTASHPNQPRSVREAAEVAATSIKYDVPKGQRLNVVSKS